MNIQGILFDMDGVLVDSEPIITEAAIRALAQRFAPGHAGAEDEIRTTWSRMHLFALDMEHVTGKECIELTRMRN